MISDDVIVEEKKEVYDKFGVEGLESGFDYGDQHQQGYTGFTGNPEEFFAQVCVSARRRSNCKRWMLLA